MKTVPQKALR
jgi:hypothetical protein